jgi:16S rRNA (guanine527-N7)-methyltransferase
VKRLAELVEAHRLPPGTSGQLARLLELVAGEPSAITTVRDPATAVDVHLADSLAGLGLLGDPPDLADLGSGGGFPGLALAIALPATAVTLVESVQRKCAFLRRAVADLGLANVEVACERVEGLAPGTFHVVTARALAELPVLLEYAAPVLRHDGLLLAWKGRRDEAEARDGEAAAAVVGMSAPVWRRVAPYPGVERHLVASRKMAPTPAAFPRRPGMARKRPLRALDGGGSGRGGP